jgi:hypothetical protein
VDVTARGAGLLALKFNALDLEIEFAEFDGEADEVFEIMRGVFGAGEVKGFLEEQFGNERGEVCTIFLNGLGEGIGGGGGSFVLSGGLAQVLRFDMGRRVMS